MENSHLLKKPGYNVENVYCNISEDTKSIHWLKLTGINLLAFGLELCASAGFTYIPPILLKNGFSDKNLATVMGIGPFISLLLVPAIGRWSDKCECTFGRRRPFMLFLGLLMVLSMFIIPFSSQLFDHGSFFQPNFCLAVGVVLLDFSSQALMNPCKALIPDIYHSSEEQISGFTVYSCMLSLGGCVGYFITSINWTNTFLGSYFGGQEKVVFSVLGVVLLFLLFANLSIAKEKPFKKHIFSKSLLNADKNCNEILGLESNVISLFTASKVVNHLKLPDVNCKDRKIKCLSIPQIVKVRLSLRHLKSGIKRLFVIVMLPIATIINYCFQEYFISPSVFQLFIACLFGWMGIMCHDMYYSDFVGQVIYRGEPHAERESIAINRYDEGVRMGSWGLLLHCLSAALYAACCQEKLIYYFGKRKAYFFGMLSFSLSLLGTVMTSNIILVNTFAALSGFGLAAITTIPYSLISEYHEKKELYYENQRGIGEDMAVLDSAFYLSQIIPSLFLGYVVNLTKSSSSYMIVAASCGAAACFFAYFVTFSPDSVRNSS